MRAAALIEEPKFRIVILPIDELKPHEKGSPIYFELLKQEVLKDQMLKYPIIADEKTCVILDGMHRWLVLKSLGYTLIPVMLVDAFQTQEVHVGTRRIHRYIWNHNNGINIDKVISAGINRQLMEPRSTRHFFSFSKYQKINYSLHLLNKRVPQDVSQYMAEITIEESSLAIKDWMEEIREEIGFLAKRKDEVEKEMEEFLHRIRHLNNGFAFS